jgi:transcriptional regulator with XRE-family HTH domain
MSLRVRRRLGWRIKQLRLRRKWTQVEFAEMLGISRSYLADIEAGRRNISIDNISIIAQGLDLSLAKLFSGV